MGVYLYIYIYKQNQNLIHMANCSPDIKSIEFVKQ